MPIAKAMWTPVLLLLGLWPGFLLLKFVTHGIVASRAYGRKPSEMRKSRGSGGLYTLHARSHRPKSHPRDLPVSRRKSPQTSEQKIPSKALWTAQEVRWTYRLGEIPLFSLRLHLVGRQGHFSEFAPIPDGPTVPHELVTSKIDGAFIRSHPIVERLPRMKIVAGLLRYCPAQYRRYWVDLTGTFPEYMAKFSSKSRSTLMRKVKRFQQISESQSSWREYKTPEEIEDFYRLAREVSQKTYQERLLDCGLPADEAFHTEIGRMAQQGRVRGYILFIEDRAIAYLYCPLWRDSGIVLYRYLGYDPEFENLSPGTVLQYFAFERLFAEPGLTMFDFLEGETPQKMFFSTDSALCADVFFLRRSPRNFALVLGREVTEAVSDTTVRVLASVGMKRWMKRFLRRGGVRGKPSKSVFGRGGQVEEPK